MKETTLLGILDIDVNANKYKRGRLTLPDQSSQGSFGHEEKSMSQRIGAEYGID